jgi:hypothetical protein
MSTKVEISNLALNMVGQQVQIASLSDASVSARLCNINIDSAIREVLRRSKWKSARARAVLVATTAPAFGWTYAYLLPVDFLRMVSFCDTDPDDVYPTPYTIEGLTLLTDESVVDIVYIKDLTDPLNNVDVNDALLTNLFVMNLAIKLCWPLQQDRSLRESIMAQFTRDLREAKVMDARDERAPIQNSLRDSSWLTARISSTNS